MNYLPTMGQLLEGIPDIQWRKCWDCGNVAVHAASTTPHVCCKQCGSQDTRLRKELTAALRSIAVKEG